MNPDPDYQRWRERCWRGGLSTAEQQDLQAWLTQHPQFQQEFDAELQLSTAMENLTDVAVATNFTTRVLKQIEILPASDIAAESTRPVWWQRYLPRFLVGSMVVVVGIVGWRHKVASQQQLVQAAQEVVATGLLTHPDVLTDFETIASLTPVMASPDEALLELGDDLMALRQ